MKGVVVAGEVKMSGSGRDMEHDNGKLRSSGRSKKWYVEERGSGRGKCVQVRSSGRSKD